MDDNNKQLNNKAVVEENIQDKIVSKINARKRETFTAHEKNIEEDYIPPTYVSETVKPTDKIFKKAEVKK